MKIKNQFLKGCILVGGLTAPVGVLFAAAPVEDLTQQEYSTPTTQGAGETPSFQPASPAPASAPSPSSGSRSTGASSPSSSVDLAARIDRLQSEVDRLRGQMEVQDNTIKRLTEQLRVQYQDLDQRLSQLSSTKKLPEQPATTTTTTTTTKPKPTTKPVNNPNSNTTENPDDSIELSGGATQNTGATANPNASKDPQTEKKEYDDAIALLKKQDYVRATTQLQRYLRDYPNGKYTASSHYWLGKIYSYQGQPDLAIAEYNTVINTYPKDPKMPNALLELGIAYDEAGDWEQAKNQLNKVVKLFPRTETAQKAEARLQKIKRQGL